MERAHRKNGELPLTVEVDEADELAQPVQERQPTSAQLAAIKQLEAREQQLIDMVLNAVAAYCNTVRENYRIGLTMFGGEDDLERIMPVGMTPQQAAARIAFSGVTVERRERDGLAYVRLDGQCTWGDEHGISVCLLGDRVVSVSLAAESVEDEQDTSG